MWLVSSLLLFVGSQFYRWSIKFILKNIDSFAKQIAPLGIMISSCWYYYHRTSRSSSRSLIRFSYIRNNIEWWTFFHEVYIHTWRLILTYKCIYRWCGMWILIHKIIIYNFLAHDVKLLFEVNERIFNFMYFCLFVFVRVFH